MTRSEFGREPSMTIGNQINVLGHVSTGIQREPVTVIEGEIED